MDSPSSQRVSYTGFDIFFDGIYKNNMWINHRDADDLCRHEVIVMSAMRASIEVNFQLGPTMIFF